MAIYTSVIYSMTNIKILAHILFQTSFSQRYVEIEKGARTHLTEKEINTGRLIFISKSYL